MTSTRKLSMALAAGKIMAAVSRASLRPWLLGSLAASAALVASAGS